MHYFKFILMGGGNILYVFSVRFGAIKKVKRRNSLDHFDHAF
jgi:hypothetical protein